MVKWAREILQIFLLLRCYCLLIRTEEVGIAPILSLQLNKTLEKKKNPESMTNVNFKTKPQYTKERKNSTFATKLQFYLFTNF